MILIDLGEMLMVKKYETELGIDANSLLYIINKCRRNPNYKAGVYTDYKNVRMQYFDLAINMLEHIYDVSRPILPIEARRFPLNIQFWNGSRIVFPVPADGARGYRHCTVLIGDEVEEKIKRCIILPAIISYDRLNPKRELPV